MSDPTLTRTTTTSDTGAWCVPATHDDEIARLREDRAAETEVWQHYVASLNAQIDDIRARLARAEVIEEDDWGAVIRFEVADRPGITIEKAAANAAEVATLFPCSIGFRFAGTTILVAPYDKPDRIVKNWKSAVEAERNPGTSPVAAQTEAERECERLRGELDERDSTIANLHVSLDAAKEDAKRLEGRLADLRTQLALSQAREAEAAKRCQAVVEAVESAYTHTTPLDSAYDDDWWAITRRDWKQIQASVDALRPATTEVRL